MPAEPPGFWRQHISYLRIMFRAIYQVMLRLPVLHGTHSRKELCSGSGLQGKQPCFLGHRRGAIVLEITVVEKGVLWSVWQAAVRETQCSHLRF